MTAHVVVVVMVHAQEVDRRCDRLEVTLADEPLEVVLAHVLDEVGRVGAEQERFEEGAIPDRVEASRGILVHRVVRVVRHGVREVECDAELLRAVLTQRARGEPVREVLVVQGRESCARLAAAGRVLAAGVADEGGA